MHLLTVSSFDWLFSKRQVPLPLSQRVYLKRIRCIYFGDSPTIDTSHIYFNKRLWSIVVHPGDEYIVGFSQREIERAKSASAIIFNTFDELECNILNTLSLKFPFCYGIGPLSLLENNISDKSLDSIKSNLWVEDPNCLKWLNAKEPLSVIYVNFGSVVVMTPQQLFLAKTSSRGLLASWCPQEQVLNHPSIGGFLMHSGWNSTIESITSGVPMICWPFFADQQPNCWWSCWPELDLDL
ncbi:putative 7-deoxyloganetin glucosyltransferase [Helianthus annuus]|nr:putative 7-deoxyloganetin glucosyltransferase [Helianthus annuus]KAJ0586091.1 putative 7-deoxyloganetin glucosyltransferase [Helianthus annuus]